MSTRKLILAWGPAVVWMGVIFFLSSRSTLPTLPRIVPDWAVKKSGHFIEYAILAMLLWRALRPTVPRSSPVTWAFALTALYALSDEWHQTYVPGRHGRLTDVVIDSAGALVGLVAVHLWYLGRNRAPAVHEGRRPVIGTGPVGTRDPEIADPTPSLVRRNNDP